MHLRTLKRLKKEWEDLKNDPIPLCTADPLDPNDLLEWKATIQGPEGTPYEGGIYHLRMTFSNEYPFRPPKTVFLTRIFHPNISTTGGICLDILKDAWSPALTVGKIVLSISSLLADPNPSDPLMPDIAQMYIDDYSMFLSRASEYTRKYAMAESNKTTTTAVVAANSEEIANSSSHLFPPPSFHPV